MARYPHLYRHLDLLCVAEHCRREGPADGQFYLWYAHYTPSLFFPWLPSF